MALPVGTARLLGAVDSGTGSLAAAICPAPVRSGHAAPWQAKLAASVRRAFGSADFRIGNHPTARALMGTRLHFPLRF